MSCDVIYSCINLCETSCLLSQLSDLHGLLVEAAEILNIEAPDLYVRQSPVPNAYTLAISGKKPFIVVHTSLIELLTREELQVHTLFCITNSMLFDWEPQF